MSVYYSDDGFTIRSEKQRIRWRVISLKTIWQIRRDLKTFDLLELLGLENLLNRDRKTGNIDRTKVTLHRLLREELARRLI